MARPKRAFPRATEPHRPAIEKAIAAYMTGKGQPSFYLFWDAAASAVILEAPSLSGVEDSAIQAAVDAAPIATNALAAQDAIDTMSPVDLAIERVHLDEINEVRAALNPAKAALTEQAHLDAIKAKVAGIIPDRPTPKPEKEKQ